MGQWTTRGTLPEPKKPQTGSPVNIEYRNVFCKWYLIQYPEQGNPINSANIGLWSKLSWQGNALLRRMMYVCEVLSVFSEPTVKQRETAVVISPIHTADATKLSSCVASAVWTQFATSSQIRSTIIGNWPNRLYSGLTTWILIDIDDFFNNDVITSSLVIKPNSSTAQEIVNWVRLPTGAFTPPTRRSSTSLLANLFRLVETVAN